MKDSSIISFKKRYISKLFVNIIGLFFAFISITIIPRVLGSKNYGDYNFLTDFFNKLLPFLTFGTSIGFFSKLSQRPKDIGLTVFYSKIVLFSIITAFVLILISQFAGLSNKLWVGQNIIFVYLAVIYSSLLLVSNSFTQVSDAYGVTVSSEIVKMLVKLVVMITIIFGMVFKLISLKIFLIINSLSCLLIILGIYFVLKRNKIDFYKSGVLDRNNSSIYFKEFFTYSAPLFTYSLVSLVTGILDTWVLQKFGGSIEQGFFALSSQIAAACFLFTSAMTPLITGEFSIAYGRLDIDEMKRIFRRYIPLMYSVSSFFSCFIFVFSDKITLIFGGQDFFGAKFTIMLMALYPIHQTYGQLSGAVFYASGKTKQYRNIGIIFMLLGLPVLSFFILPNKYWGLNLGSSGLALKNLILQFLYVNVQLYYNSKFLGFIFYKYLLHQIASILILILVGLIIRYFVDYTILKNLNIISYIVISGSLYLILVTSIIVKKPIFFGLYKKDINYIFNIVLNKNKNHAKF